jgi:glycosyltransferase involved in cell wall biosynthesis
VQGKRVLRRVDGVVGVTDELSEFQGARAGEGVPTFTHANGIDVRAVSPTGFVPFDGRHLRLVFTASSFAPWHGTDRLLASLRAYDGPLTVTLDLVGAGSGRAAGTEERAGRTTVRHHGALYGGDLGRVLAGANIAVSTLAFHRTGLREGAVLKTREYLARGVPLVLGYDDVDVPEGLPFVLQVPNDDALLSVEALADFAERTGRIRNLTAEMRAYAERVLDWRIKLPRLEEFARRLLDSPKRHAAR